MSVYGCNRIGGATGFLRILFFTEIAFALSEFVLRKISHKYIYVEIVFALISQVLGRYILTIQDHFCGKLSVLVGNMHVCFMAYGLLVLGRIVNRLLRAELIERVLHTNSFRISVASLMLGIVLHTCLSISGNSFIFYEYGIMTSFGAWMIEWGMAGIIETFIIPKQCISYLGTKSLSILIGHMAALKLVNLLVVKFDHLPDYYRGAFLAINSTNWWYLYSIAGIMLPLIVYKGYEIIKKVTIRSLYRLMC